MGHNPDPVQCNHKMTNQKRYYLIHHHTSCLLRSFHTDSIQHRVFIKWWKKRESKTHSISKLLVTVLKMAAITSRISFDSNSTVLSVEPNRTEASRDITRSLQDSNKHNMQKKKLIANTLPLKNNTSYCLV